MTTTWEIPCTDAYWIEVTVERQLGRDTVVSVEAILTRIQTRLDTALEGPLAHTRGLLGYMDEGDGWIACLTSDADLPSAAEDFIWSSLRQLRELLAPAATASTAEGA